MIVLLTNEFPQYAGGVATYCYEITRAIVAQGYAMTVVAAQKHHKDLAFDRVQDFPIYRVPENKWAILRHLNRFVSLQRRIRECNPSILWASDWRTGLTVMPLARQFSIPYIVTAYGTEVLMAAENRHKRHIALHIFNRSHLILSISHYTRQLLVELGIAAEKIKVTPLGITPGMFAPDAARVAEVIRRHNLEGKNVVLTLARLTARKGQDMMIRAMSEVLKSVPSAVYVIAGRGEDEQRLKRLVADLGLESHIVFAGYVSDEEKAAYYQVCDVYVMLSRQEGHFVEGFGLTLLEAGAYEKPVVAGRHGGVPEVVLDGETGLLVDPNSIQDVAAAVIRILCDQEQAQRMGRNARLWVEQAANWDTTARLTLAEITKVQQI